MFAKLTTMALFLGCIAYCQFLPPEAESSRLIPGQVMQAHVFADKPPHFLIEIQEGHPARIVVNQHADLKVEWQRQGGPSHVVDSFEFGPETATLRESGTYILEVNLSNGQGDVQ